MQKQFVISLLLIIWVNPLKAKDFRTNEFLVKNAPSWVKASKIEKIADRIQSQLEWSTRRVPLIWHSHESSFAKVHKLRPMPLAVTIKSPKKTEIHLGPGINKKNYAKMIGHELVHVVFFQKYHGAIPPWLEEGFANHLSKQDPVNYKWLSKQILPKDVTKMQHPYKQTNIDLHVHYKSSQALVEMLKKKCDLSNLLRLSVERKMANYIKSYCNIKDINKSFHDWIKRKALSKNQSI